MHFTKFTRYSQISQHFIIQKCLLILDFEPMLNPQVPDRSRLQAAALLGWYQFTTNPTTHGVTTYPLSYAAIHQQCRYPWVAYNVLDAAQEKPEAYQL